MIKADRLLALTAAFLLATVALALPWELYQLLPWTTTTLTKTAGALLIPVAAVLAIRRRTALRTGLEWPIALFAAACLLSWTVSVMPPLTVDQLIVYATYLAFFYAVIATVPLAISARALMACYVLSAVGVALVTIAAFAGVLWPMKWAMATSWWEADSLLERYRAGLPLRMTGASGDFNLAALELLVALGFVLFAWRPRRALWTLLQWGAAALILAAIALAMSRSGIALAAALVLAALITQLGRARRTVLPAVLGFVTVACIAIIALRPEFVAVLWDRTFGALLHGEASAGNRMDVYQIAFRMLGDYIWLGCGLGAVDVAMAQSPYAEDAVMTVHSLPFKFLLETGFLGLIGYLAISFVATRAAVLRLKAADPTTRNVARGFLAAFAAAWLLLLVQPFPMLSLYPFLLGLMFGPVAAERFGERPLPLRVAPALSIAAAATFAIVLFCMVTYQRAVTTSVAYRDLMTRGYNAQQAGAWNVARSAYAKASVYGDELLGDRMLEAVFGARALSVMEITALSEELSLPGIIGVVNPYNLAVLSEGRVALAQGHLEHAQSCFEKAWEYFPPYETMRFTLAEANWRAGRFEDALAQYEAWAELPEDFRPRPDAVRLAALLEASRADHPPLLRAASLRRLGRWEQAVKIYQRLADLPSPPAEALYNRGVAAEIAGQTKEAVEHCRTALEISPDHVAAQERLAVITE